MKNKIIRIFSFFSIVILLFQAWGCSKNTSPIANIKEKYGNQQFNITFDCTDANLKPLTYSAYHIPQLKNPKKVGYIFKGWFFDKSFTSPYSQEALYLKMHDITLYPKWEQELITQPGIYQINYQANLIDESVVLGKDANKVAPYKNLCSLFISDDIVLEKTTDDKLLLKLSYDQKMIMPFPNDSDIFLITPNIKMGSKVKEHSAIASLSDTKRTLYFDITKFDLANELLFNVRFYNYYESNINKELLYTSQVNYQIKFRITSVIGLAKPFISANKELSDGFYKIKGYLYKGEKVNELSMLNLWNSIYMDLVVEDGKYYLYHTFKTYEGIIPNYLINNPLDNIKHRMMTFFYAPTYYTYDKQYDDIIDYNGYLPEVKQGSYLRGSEITFDAPKKEITHKYYLGETIHNNIMFQGVLTGFMEQVSALGVTNVAIHLDRNSITRVGVINNHIINSKTAYTFTDQITYYPGAYSDLRVGNIFHNFITNNNKVNNRIANFFLKQKNGSEAILSHKLMVIPKQNRMVKDARYELYDFDFIYEIYDCEQDNQLIIDYNLFHLTDGFLRRESDALLHGKSCVLNEVIKPQELFKKYIRNDIDINYVKWQIFKNDKTITLPNTFPFQEKIKILYQYNQNNTTYFAWLHLILYEEPMLMITNKDGSEYLNNSEYLLGDKVFLPHINYSWMGRAKSYYGDNKYNNDGEIHPQIDYMHLLFFYESKNEMANYYVPIFSDFTFAEEKIHIYFAITNPFFEVKLYHLSFSAKKPLRYKIVDHKDNLIAFNTIRYFNNKRLNIKTNNTFLYPAKNLDYFHNCFFLYEDETLYYINLTKVIIYFKDKDCITLNHNTSDDFASLITNLKVYYNDLTLVYFKFIYEYQNYVITQCLLFHYRLNYRANENLYSYQKFYTETLYQKITPFLTLNGIRVPNYGSAYLYNSDATKAGHALEIKKDGHDYYKFIKPGKYKFVYNVSLKLNPNGEFATKEQITHSFTFVFYVEVCDWQKETVEITFVSNSHPFKDNTTTKTKTFYLKDLINLYSYTDFIVNNRDHLAGFAINPKYTTKEYTHLIKGGYALQDFAHNYACATLTLYAIWDSPICVQFKVPNHIANDVFDDIWLYAPNGGYFLNLKNFAPQGYDKRKFKFVGWRGEITNNEIIFDENITFDKCANYFLEAVFEVC